MKEVRQDEQGGKSIPAIQSQVAAPRPVKNLFISSTPGVGKTTLIKEVTLPYRDRLGGFYTEEVREEGERSGFLLKTFPAAGRSGEEGLIARKGLKSRAKVGKYGVDLAVLEGLGVAAIKDVLLRPGHLIVIDEIGSMEVQSDIFRTILLECLQSPDHPVLATIRHNAQPFTSHVKRMENVELIQLTRQNYPDVKERVRRWLEETLR